MFLLKKMSICNVKISPKILGRYMIISHINNTAAALFNQFWYYILYNT